MGIFQTVVYEDDIKAPFRQKAAEPFGIVHKYGLNAVVQKTVCDKHGPLRARFENKNSRQLRFATNVLHRTSLSQSKLLQC